MHGSRDLCLIQPALCPLEDFVSCGSRKDTTDDTVLELSGQDCLSQLVTPIY